MVGRDSCLFRVALAVEFVTRIMPNLAVNRTDLGAALPAAAASYLNR